MPEVDGPQLSYVVLFCADLPASLRFYRDGLGLPVSGPAPGPEASFVMLAAGGVRLGLHAGSQERRTRDVNLHFAVPDVEAAVAACTARGVRFGGPPTDRPWGARVACAADPDGNEVELVQWVAGR